MIRDLYLLLMGVLILTIALPLIFAGFIVEAAINGYLFGRAYADKLISEIDAWSPYDN